MDVIATYSSGAPMGVFVPDWDYVVVRVPMVTHPARRVSLNGKTFFRVPGRAGEHATTTFLSLQRLYRKSGAKISNISKKIWI